MGRLIQIYVRDEDIHLVEKLKAILKRKRRSLSVWFIEQVEAFLEEIENEHEDLHKEAT